MKNTKYILTDVSKEVLGVKLFQIKALVAFGNVSKDELGGWIEKEENLSVSGNAWVYGDASVSGNAWVYGDASVSGNAWVSGDARVYGDASVSGNAWVYGNASVSGNAWVSGDARVYGDASVSGNAWVYGNAWVSGNAWVYGKFDLSLGYFFGTRYNNEEIKFFRTKKSEELIYKGEAKIEERKEEVDKNVEVAEEIIELNGKKYKLINH